VRELNAYFGTSYRFEDVEHWPDHRIDQLRATMKMWN
jgi:hypothetical protein